MMPTPQNTPEEVPKKKETAGAFDKLKKLQESVAEDNEVVRQAGEREAAAQRMKDQKEKVAEENRDEAEALVRSTITEVNKIQKQSIVTELQAKISDFITQQKERKDDSVDPEAAEKEHSDTDEEPSDSA